MGDIRRVGRATESMESLIGGDERRLQTHMQLREMASPSANFGGVAWSVPGGGGVQAPFAQHQLGTNRQLSAMMQVRGLDNAVVSRGGVAWDIK